MKAYFILVTPAGVEPAIFWMRTRRPGPLDEGANIVIISYEETVVNREKSLGEALFCVVTTGFGAYCGLVRAATWRCEEISPLGEA